MCASQRNCRLHIQTWHQLRFRANRQALTGAFSNYRSFSAKIDFEYSLRLTKDRHGGHLTSNMGFHLDTSIVETTNMNTEEALFILLVGALWGCTNPLMRKASQSPRNQTSDIRESKASPIRKWITRLANIKIWLPYAINQLGSLLYYKLLASSRLTLLVPSCNATAMAFSCATSLLLGERIDKPFRAGMGAVLIMIGSGICMMANENGGNAAGGDVLKDEL